MKKTIIILAAAIFGILAAINLQATQKGSVTLGKKLFNDPSLAGSGNAKSCNTCHPGGKGLEQAGNNPKLAGIINQCIAGPLAGQPLALDSSEMQSLTMYIKSLKK
jgi:cytochrome c peroxidase